MFYFVCVVNIQRIWNCWPLTFYEGLWIKPHLVRALKLYLKHSGDWFKSQESNSTRQKGHYILGDGALWMVPSGLVCRFPCGQVLTQVSMDPQSWIKGVWCFWVIGNVRKIQGVCVGWEETGIDYWGGGVLSTSYSYFKENKLGMNS